MSDVASAPTVALPAGLPRLGAVVGGRFELLDLVGTGGMGAVYRARDRELDEQVALKVLLPSTDDPDALPRFFREVRLARRVTHPNVARTYDGGRDGDLRFLTMELVEGASLRERFRTPPPLPEALRIAAEIARGLAAAHAAGVVHRDLKLDNVLFDQGGRVVLTDFGIARAASAATETRVLVGTPRTMAPEQLRGEAVDGRADVYALGLLLYELLTSVPVFDDGPTTTAARALGTAVPPRLDVVLPGTPAALAQLVAEQLSPRREDRPDAQQTLERLESMRGAASPLDRAPRLPALSPELLARARNTAPRTLTLAPLHAHDELARTLAQDLGAAAGDVAAAVSGLRVVGEPPAELALSGSVAVEPPAAGGGEGAVCVRLRLVEVARRTVVWAEQVLGSTSDPFALEDEVTRRLHDVLVAQAGGALRGGPTDARVRAVYERAREAFHRFDAVSVRAAVEILEDGLRVHPGDAWLGSLLGAALARVFLQDGGREPEIFARAEELSLRALAVDSSIAETYMTLAALRLATGELRATARALHEVLERAPLHAQAQHALGKLLVESGFVDEGLPRLELARRLQPGLALAYVELARTHALFGRRAEAEKVLAEAVATLGEPVGVFPAVRLAFWWNDPDYARATADLVERHASGAAWEASVPLLRAYSEGRADPSAPASFARLVEGVRAAPHHRCFMHQIAAEYFGAVGDAERSLTALERAAELPLIDVTWLDRCPALALVRDDPRFLRLRAVVGVRAAELWA